MGRGGMATDEVTLLARKWFRRYGDENVQHQLAVSTGDNINGTILLGLSTSRINSNYSYVFVDSVNANAPKNNQGEWRFNGEVTVHELIHLWQVNPSDPGGGGHCTANRYDSSAALCAMHGSYTCPGSTNGTCAEFYDGTVALHFVNGDSEYWQIRRRSEPFPQY